MNTDFKPKWIKWDEDAFRADRVVQRMTSIQRSLCRTLMIECYYNALRPYLPNDDSLLWELADAESLEHWLQNKERIISKFDAISGDDGTAMLMNKRVMEEWDDLEAGLAQKKNAAAASVASRREKAAKKGSLHSPKRTEEKRIEQNRALNDRSTLVQSDESKGTNPCATERSHVSVSSSANEVAETVHRVWDYYITTLNKDSKLLSLTSLRKQKGTARLHEALAKSGGDMAKAEKLMKLAVDTLAASKFHRGENDRNTAYDSWEKHLFQSQEKLEWWWEKA